MPITTYKRKFVPTHRTILEAENLVDYYTFNIVKSIVNDFEYNFEIVIELIDRNRIALIYTGEIDELIKKLKKDLGL